MRKIFILSVLIILSTVYAMADDCRINYYMSEINGRYYPTFERQACSRGVTISYKVHFSDGTSDQMRVVYIMGSSYGAKERGVGYDRWGSIEILKYEWSESSALNHPDSGSGNSNNYYDIPEKSLGKEFSYSGIGLGYGLSYGTYGAKFLSRLSDNVVVLGVSAGLGYGRGFDTYDMYGREIRQKGTLAWSVGLQWYMGNCYFDFQYGKKNYLNKNYKGWSILFGSNITVTDFLGLNLALGTDFENIKNSSPINKNTIIWEVGVFYKFSFHDLIDP